TTAASPGRVDVGHWARTTVACTKRRRWAINSATRADSCCEVVIGSPSDRWGVVPLHRFPHAARGERHVGVADAVGLERVDARVDDRRRRADRGRLADALG